MQLRHLGFGLLVALTVLLFAGTATAHANDTAAGDPPYGGSAADWAAWMEAHMGPGTAEWMEAHMGVTIEEMGSYMADSDGTGPHGSGPRGGGCY